MILAILPFGYLAAQSLKNKKTKDDKKDNSRCFDIKKLLAEKLKEITDLKGSLESKIQNKAREKIRDAVRETSTREMLAQIEGAEKEFKRLEKLYENCIVEFQPGKRVIIIHGCPSNVEKAMDPQTRTHDKHWIPWLKKELIIKGIKVEVPLMPTPWKPEYEKFKEELEKYTITENTTLIGHSCGGAFLVRWLGETKRKIHKLILVAPWKIPDGTDAIKKAFYEYTIHREVRSQVKEIIMFTADDEEEDGKKSLEIFYNALGGKIVNLKGRGHYMLSDMGTEKFPELLEEILS